MKHGNHTASAFNPDCCTVLFFWRGVVHLINNPFRDEPLGVLWWCRRVFSLRLWLAAHEQVLTKHSALGTDIVQSSGLGAANQQHGGNWAQMAHQGSLNAYGPQSLRQSVLGRGGGAWHSRGSGRGHPYSSAESARDVLKNALGPKNSKGHRNTEEGSN